MPRARSAAATSLAVADLHEAEVRHRRPCPHAVDRGEARGEVVALGRHAVGDRSISGRVAGGGRQGGEGEGVGRPRRAHRGQRASGERRGRPPRSRPRRPGIAQRLGQAAHHDHVVEALTDERRRPAGHKLHERLVDGDDASGPAAARGSPRRARASRSARRDCPTTTRSAASGTAAGRARRPAPGSRSTRADRDAVGAQRGLGLGEARVHAGGERGPQGERAAATAGLGRRRS
jgi:hypothetical protein